MRVRTSAIVLLGLLALSPASSVAQEEAGSGSTNPQLVLDTTEGVIIIELFREEAPLSVANVMQYVEEGFYTETIFHRVIDRFMVQLGGYDQDLVKKDVRESIRNEADNGLSNTRGTVAMALKPGDPHSATAQFFVNTVNNSHLDHRNKTTNGWGYAVFGRVVEGMSTVDRISRVRTRTRSGHRDVPLVPILIERATVRWPEPGADE